MKIENLRPRVTDGWIVTWSLPGLKEPESEKGRTPVRPCPGLRRFRYGRQAASNSVPGVRPGERVDRVPKRINVDRFFDQEIHQCQGFSVALEPFRMGSKKSYGLVWGAGFDGFSDLAA